MTSPAPSSLIHRLSIEEICAEYFSRTSSCNLLQFRIFGIFSSDDFTICGHHRIRDSCGHKSRCHGQFSTPHAHHAVTPGNCKTSKRNHCHKCCIITGILRNYPNTINYVTDRNYQVTNPKTSQQIKVPIFGAKIATERN